MRYNANPSEEEVLSEKLWTIYSWWASVLILKMMSLTWITGRVRVAKQVIHSEEDRIWMKGSHVILSPSGGGHPAVDRIRSAHYNDLAIVLPYLLIVPIWLSTLPSFIIARTIMLCFAMSNVLSTLIHFEVLDAPDLCKTISRVCSPAILVYICFACMARYFDLA